MELRSAGRSRGNPVTGERRASPAARSGLVPPEGWRELAVPVYPYRKLYFSRRELWIGYRRDLKTDCHMIAFLGLVWAWAHK